MKLIPNDEAVGQVMTVVAMCGACVMASVLAFSALSEWGYVPVMSTSFAIPLMFLGAVMAFTGIVADGIAKQNEAREAKIADSKKE